MKRNKPLFLALLAASSLLFLAGCGKSNSAETDTADATAQDVFPEMEAYFATKVSLPAAVFEDLEAGRITQRGTHDDSKPPKCRHPGVCGVCAC